MLNPALHRLCVFVFSLAALALACTRAELPLVPSGGQIATPLPIPPTETPPTAPPSNGAPTEAATTGPYPAPGETTLANPYPVPGDTATPIPPGETPTPTETAAPTETAPSGLAAIPDNATFTQAFTVSGEGGELVGRAQDLADGQTITWASLRDGGGDEFWIFDLGSEKNVAGLLVYAHRDGNEDTTLQTIEVSTDGTTWTPVYVATGDCGFLACDILTQDEYVDLPFGPARARYVRLRGGDTRFALAEVQVATVP
jgi:hypothetical protein